MPSNIPMTDVWPDRAQSASDIPAQTDPTSPRAPTQGARSSNTARNFNPRLLRFKGMQKLKTITNAPDFLRGRFHALRKTLESMDDEDAARVEISGSVLQLSTVQANAAAWALKNPDFLRHYREQGTVFNGWNKLSKLSDAQFKEWTQKVATDPKGAAEMLMVRRKRKRSGAAGDGAAGQVTKRRKINKES